MNIAINVARAISTALWMFSAGMKRKRSRPWTTALRLEEETNRQPLGSFSGSEYALVGDYVACLAEPFRKFDP